MSLPRFLTTLVFACALTAAARADVGVGDSRDSVLQTYGKPTSIARRVDHEIFLYPKGGRIEFIDGKVVTVRAPLPPPIAVPTEPAPAPTSIESPPAQIIPAKPTPESKPVPPPTPKPAAPPGYNPAVAANALGDKVEKMNSAWGPMPEMPKAPSALNGMPALITGLLLRFAFTILALKIAFKYWEMDAFWKGIFAIAGIDLGVHAVLKLLGPLTGGITTMGGVENGVAGVVLIFTINRFCFNKRLHNAVTTAAAVKVVVTLCYVFGGVALLNLVYG